MSTIIFTIICGLLLLSTALFIIQLRQTQKTKNYGSILIKYHFLSKRMTIFLSIFMALVISLSIIGLIDRFSIKRLITDLLMMLNFITMYYGLTMNLTFSTLGIGKTFMFKKFMFACTPWEDIKSWNWSSVDKELLILNISIDGTIKKTEMHVPEKHKAGVENILKEMEYSRTLIDMSN